MAENKNAKPITPYTQRPVELFIQKSLERPYYLQDAFGSNLAPLTARAHFIKKHIKRNFVETFPDLSFARLAEQLKLPQKFLKQEGKSFESETARHSLLTELLEKRFCFVYQQDISRLIENPDAFDAFLAAYTAFLNDVGECEERPKGFPIRDQWVAFPRLDISWDLLFKMPAK